MRAFLGAAALAVAIAVSPARAEEADATLTAQEYVARGLPAIDRTWAPPDYTVASRVLADVPLDQLPRTNSARSGAVIDRLVDRSSITPCQAQAGDVMMRVQVCAPLLGAVSQILMRYSMTLQSDATRGEDNLRILNYTLFVAAEVGDMVTAIAPTLDPNAPDYATRFAGLNQARNGLSQMIAGTCMTLETPAGPFPEHARAATARALAEVYARMMANVPPEVRPTLEQRVRALGQNDHNPDVRAALAAIATQ